MAEERLRFSDDARHRMLSGVNALANAVKVTWVLKDVTWSSSVLLALH